jgi:hypothetical protein
MKANRILAVDFMNISIWGNLSDSYTDLDDFLHCEEILRRVSWETISRIVVEMNLRLTGNIDQR